MLSWFQIPVSKPRRSLFSNQLAHPTGAYSGSLRMKRLGELHCKVTPLLPPPPKISSHFPDNFPVPIYTPEWREAPWKFCFLLANTTQWPGWVMNPNLSTWGPTHHRAECLDIIGYSWALKREIWMRSRLGKPTIREERAETGATAWVKLARPIARSNHWETQGRDFEEEGFTFN